MPAMSTNTACTIDNVSPERMGLYFSRSDVEDYLHEIWPQLPMTDFQISVSSRLIHGKGKQEINWRD